MELLPDIGSCYIPACVLPHDHPGKHRKIEAIGHWRPTPDPKPCRRQQGRTPSCGEPSIAEVNRGRRTPDGKVDSWWAYCSDHSYSRSVDGQRVIFEWELDPVSV